MTEQQKTKRRTIFTMDNSKLAATCKYPVALIAQGDLHHVTISHEKPFILCYHIIPVSQEESKTAEDLASSLDPQDHLEFENWETRKIAEHKLDAKNGGCCPAHRISAGRLDLKYLLSQSEEDIQEFLEDTEKKFVYASGNCGFCCESHDYFFTQNND